MDRKKGVIKRAIEKYLLIALLVIVLIAIFINPFTYGLMKGLMSFLVNEFGLLGMFLAVIIMDTIIQPVSPDVLVFSSALGGASVFWVVLIAGIASCIGGALGYFIAHKAGSDNFKRWFGEERFKHGEKLIAKYGIWAVVVGAWTPIPYSVVCWTAGIYKLNFLQFFLTSLLTRIPRFLVMGLIGSAL